MKVAFTDRTLRRVAVVLAAHVAPVSRPARLELCRRAPGARGRWPTGAPRGIPPDQDPSFAAPPGTKPLKSPPSPRATPGRPSPALPQLLLGGPTCAEFLGPVGTLAAALAAVHYIAGWDGVVLLPASLLLPAALGFGEAARDFWLDLALPAGEAACRPLRLPEALALPGGVASGDPLTLGRALGAAACAATWSTAWALLSAALAPLWYLAAPALRRLRGGQEPVRGRGRGRGPKPAKGDARPVSEGDGRRVHPEPRPDTGIGCCWSPGFS